MYHPEVTKRAVSRMSEQMRAPLEYHSSEQIESANRHFKTVWDPEERRILRPLEGDEKRWIRNELTLCQLDFRYWCGNYAMIRDWQKRLVTCKLNLAQTICLDIWGDLENKGRSITCQKLKARQLGMSTITELAVAHRTQFYAGVKSIVASSDPDKSAEMARMMERCWDNQPFFLVPETTGYKKGERIEFGKQDSALSIQHGTQFSGIARGDTPSVAHLSEVCDYTDPEDLIDASLLRCMHESPNLFLVLESTAQGRHNYWHKTWDLSKQGYWEGRSRFCPVFLPWYVGSDIYPTETWIRTRPVPEDWIPAGMTQRHSERAQDYVRSNPILAKHLGADWIMPRKQMWFWEVTRDEYKAKGILNRFFAELCADDLEAFQSTNMSAFDADIISTYRENAGRMPKAVLAITGPSIPVRLQPDRRDIDPRYKPIKIDDDFELIPLRFNGYSGMDPAGKLLVWNFPEDNYEYGLGVDTSDGVGLDRSVIEVIRKGNFYENDVQVAEFANPYVNASDLAPICYAIGKFYSPLNNEGNLKQARIVIECNGNGEAAQHELRKMGWSHFHQWARYDQKKLRIGNSHKIGWFTTGWSRLMMMDYLVKALRDDMIDIQSPYFVDEMSDLDRDENRQSIRASYGGHDDRIMALGMCWFSLHVMELLGPLKSIMRNRLEQQNEAIVYPRYSPGFQAKELAHESPLWDSFDPEDYDLIQDQLPVWNGG